MYVRAIYIPLCKKISSVPGLSSLYEPSFLSLSLSLSPCSLLHPRFSSSCRVSCLSRPPLEPPAHRYPRCLQREQPSSRRFGKLPLFLSRWNISAASREEDASRRTKRNGQTRNGSSARRTFPLGIPRLWISGVLTFCQKDLRLVSRLSYLPRGTHGKVVQLARWWLARQGNFLESFSCFFRVYPPPCWE